MAVALITLSASAAYCGIGGQGGAVFRGPAGAAAFSLGGAQTADPSALRLWWNPAALSYVKSRTASLGGGYRSMGRTEGNASIELKLPPRMGVGMAFVYRGDPFLDELRDRNEELLPQASFSAIAVNAGFSYQISRKVAAGLAVEYLHEKMPAASTVEGTISYANSSPALGINLGMAAMLSERWRIGLTLKHMLAKVEMSVTDNTGWLPSLEDTLLMPLTLGQTLRFTCIGHPLIWSTDIGIAALRSDFSRATHADAVVNNGFEWQPYEKFRIRLGVREIHLNRDLFRDSQTWGASFRPSITGGFGFDPVRPAGPKGGRTLSINYGIGTDRVMHGVDQQLDLTVLF